MRREVKNSFFYKFRKREPVRSEGRRVLFIKEEKKSCMRPSYIVLERIDNSSTYRRSIQIRMVFFLCVNAKMASPKSGYLLVEAIVIRKKCKRAPKIAIRDFYNLRSTPRWVNRARAKNRQERININNDSIFIYIFILLLQIN